MTRCGNSISAPSSRRLSRDLALPVWYAAATAKDKGETAEYHLLFRLCDHEAEKTDCGRPFSRWTQYFFKTLPSGRRLQPTRTNISQHGSGLQQMKILRSPDQLLTVTHPRNPHCFKNTVDTPLVFLLIFSTSIIFNCTFSNVVFY